ncbi:hypothetical protein AM363_08075 [Citrobacter freundii]|uniref:Phage protein n=1 Tax=Citrobacter freundii TaxID=546 RepID=A0AB33GWI5_CITFR|nr:MULTISPECIES: hypothetical protein [Citrobacter]AUZ63992.1 hypothetical protein C2U53_09140 [Citrobacter sp. CFNIH10]AXZ46912.1 hypothetical protein AM363_08075 [Citrobacter freundii]MDU7776368.1 hypothetical protein [Citrobacter sp.]
MSKSNIKSAGVSVPAATNELKATPDGVMINGTLQTYSYIINLFENGTYDSLSADAYQALHVIHDANQSGWVEPDLNQQIAMWRWLVASMFIRELEKNGCEAEGITPGEDKYYTYAGGGIPIPLRMMNVRNALMCLVETQLLQVLGGDEGKVASVEAYRTMVTNSPEDGGLILSDDGMRQITGFLDAFITMAVTGAFPDSQAIH